MADPIQSDSILKKLDDARVVTFYPSEDGLGLIAEESCDNYFRVPLNVQEVRQLAQELIRLSELIESQ
jgi:hypothetical protein